MNFSAYILKRSSPNSKGIACLRFDRAIEPYPRELIRSLKRNWHFLWFTGWKRALHEIPYHDLIDIFVVWDDLVEELAQSGRTDYVVIRGGSETYQRHDLHFHPLTDVKRDIDLLYIARFTASKRPDVALGCVNYVKERNPHCKAIFLESHGSQLQVRQALHDQIIALGLQDNLRILSVPLQEVNSYMNRARLSLFTSDVEGMCRAVIQTLLAERPLLCYAKTKALTRILFDDRYFRFYEEQTSASIGAAAWTILQSGWDLNTGARNYVLKEKKFVFHDIAEWRNLILHAAEPLFLRDGQSLDWNDVVPVNDATPLLLWREFQLKP